MLKDMRRQYRSTSEQRPSYHEVQNQSSSQFDLNRNVDENSYIGSPRLMKTSRRQSYINPSLIPNLALYEHNEADINNEYVAEPSSYAFNSLNGVCNECGEYRQIVRCLAHCNLILCESCKSQHWNNEINELMNIKIKLEDNVGNIRKYLVSKKQQCSENIKSCQQIKKFIAMTMQQIKRKIELELENKRDELYDTIDSFVDNQKKISQSINEEGLMNSDRINQEIDNVLLSTGDEMNFFKVKTIKGLAKLQVERLEKQNSKKIPFYSIFFLPDSAIQIQNSFGKILLKSYQEDEFDLTDSFPQKDTYDDNKPFKSKNLNQMQKWSSSESFNIDNKNTKAVNLNAEGPNVRKSTSSKYNFQSKVDCNYENDNNQPVTPDIELLTPKVSPRTLSQPAPATRHRLHPPDTGVFSSNKNDLSVQSGHSSTDDYFSSFKAPIQKNNGVSGSDEDDILSI